MQQSAPLYGYSRALLLLVGRQVKLTKASRVRTELVTVFAVAHQDLT